MDFAKAYEHTNVPCRSYLFCQPLLLQKRNALCTYDWHKGRLWQCSPQRSPWRTLLCWTATEANHFWLENYLTDRTLQFFSTTHGIQTRPLTKGVPQGRVLSPMLYILYVRMLAHQVRRLFRIIQFADDALFHFGHRSMVIARQILKAKSWKPCTTSSFIGACSLIRAKQKSWSLLHKKAIAQSNQHHLRRHRNDRWSHVLGYKTWLSVILEGPNQQSSPTLPNASKHH
jgi:Reverse transcriptase (RNA-dependent DNA polymerase)